VDIKYLKSELFLYQNMNLKMLFVHGNVTVKPLYSHLKHTNMSFFKNGEQVGKIGPAWELAPVGGGKI
jgi:hypothetical protein